MASGDRRSGARSVPSTLKIKTKIQLGKDHKFTERLCDAKGTERNEFSVRMKTVKRLSMQQVHSQRTMIESHR